MKEKEMWVVVRMKDIPSLPGWVQPVDTTGLDEERVLKSRVIYADEIHRYDYYNHNKLIKEINLINISPTPELEDEWERWRVETIRSLQKAYFAESAVVALVDVLRKMPKREKT
jgi:hypothetical protein